MSELCVSSARPRQCLWVLVWLCAALGLVQAQDLPSDGSTQVTVTGIDPGAPATGAVVIGGGVLRAAGDVVANGKSVTDASGLTTGTLSDARLSSNVPRLSATAAFIAAQTIAGTAPTTVAANQTVIGGGTIRTANDVITAGKSVKDASGLTTGTLADARLSTNIPRLSATAAFVATQTIAGTAPSTVAAGQTAIGGGVIRTAGDVIANGKSVTDASGLTTGTLPDARLSANVPKLDAANTFTNGQVITGGVAPTSASAAEIRAGAGVLRAGTDVIAAGTSVRTKGTHHLNSTSLTSHTHAHNVPFTCLMPAMNDCLP